MTHEEMTWTVKEQDRSPTQRNLKASLEYGPEVDGKAVHPVGPHGAELEGRPEADLLRGERVQVERPQSTNVGDWLRYWKPIGVLRRGQSCFSTLATELSFYSTQGLHGSTNPRTGHIPVIGHFGRFQNYPYKDSHCIVPLQGYITV